MTRRFQFSLKALLGTITSVAVVLALMLQAKPAIGTPALTMLVIAESALALTGLVNGRSGLRAFCTGALVPLGIMIAWMATNLASFISVIQFEDSEDWYVAFPRFLGAGILISIVVGYLCVGFRRLISGAQE